MKTEMYECYATKTWLENETPMDDTLYFRVKAMGHIQRHPGSTNLQKLSKAGLEKIRSLRADGYFVAVTVGGRGVGIENE